MINKHFKWSPFINIIIAFVLCIQADHPKLLACTFVTLYLLTSFIFVNYITTCIIWGLALYLFQILSGPNKHVYFVMLMLYEDFKVDTSPINRVFGNSLLIVFMAIAMCGPGKFSTLEIIVACQAMIICSVIGILISMNMKVKKSNAELSCLHNTITDWLFKLDKNFVIIELNREFMGKPVDHFLQKNFVQQFCENEKTLINEMEDKLKNVIKSRLPMQWDCKIEQTYFTIIASPMLMNEEVINISVRIQDVTDIMLSKEREIRALKAEHSTRAKSEFISSMSHEIRNPLQSITYSLQLLNLTELGTSQSEYVQEIVDATNLLTSIIGDVLDLSKIEAGKIELLDQPLYVQDICETSADIVASRAHRKGLELITQVDQNIPSEVIGDKTRLIQVLSNFASNAVKFTETGYVKISAELVEATPTDATILFKCTDTGIGIAKKDQKRLFNRFEQISQSRSSKHIEGWGLGLAICTGLAKAMKGEIGVESELGRGSTFWLKVTLRRVCNTNSYLRSTDFKAIRNQVLVVTHSQELCKVLFGYLKSLNFHKLYSASTSKEISQILANNHDLVILVDHELSHMVKLETLHVGHKLIIMTTRNSDTSELAEKKSSSTTPLDDPFQTVIIRKPIKFRDLMRVLSGKRRSLSDITTASVVKNARASFKEKKISVLIAEDNPVIQKLLHKLLTQCGITDIEQAYDGIEALKKVEKRKHFDVILMDIQMPKMDGLTAIQRIRSMKDTTKSQIPIIATTADIWQSSVTMCMDAGASDVVGKPISIENLVKAILKVINLN